MGGIILQFVMSMAPAILKWVLGMFMSKEKADEVAERTLEYIKQKAKLLAEKSSKLVSWMRSTDKEVEQDRQDLINKNKK